jgi:DNA-binding NtrC family response regulator
MSAVRVLLIEDDKELREGWEEIFEFLGFSFRSYDRGLGAVMDPEAVQEADVLVTDYYLPDLNGVDLIRRLRQIKPELRAILLTGSRETSVLSSARELDDCTVLFKPLNIDQLEKEIMRVKV